MKKVISIFMSAVMLFAVTTASIPEIRAEENVQNDSQLNSSGIQGDISMEGENSIGDLMTDVIDAELNSQQENNGFNVFSVDVTGKNALVSYESLNDCTVVVGIYDDAGEKLIATGTSDASKENKEILVELETDTMPEYFYIRAYLVDSSLRPLCTSYESAYYTKEMQEFLSKTTDDFDQEKVLDFDGDKTNNFAVYSEDTTIIEQNNNENIIAEADDSNMHYVIENAGEDVTNLQPGDIFALEADNSAEDVLIVKVKSISVNGTTAEITGQDTSIEEVFEYVRIEDTAGLDEATIDPSVCSEGVTYLGLEEQKPSGSQVQSKGVQASAESGSVTYPKSEKIEIKKEMEIGEGKGKIKGSISAIASINCEAVFSFYLSKNYSSIELKFNYGIVISAAVTGKVEFKIPIPVFKFTCAGIVNAEVTPFLFFEGSAKIQVDGAVNGTIGARGDTVNGVKNITTTPVWSANLKGEIDFYFGLGIEPEVEIISEKLASAKFSGKVGVDVKASKDFWSVSTDPESIHDCKNCFKGSISFKAKLDFEAKLLDNEKNKLNINIAEVVVPLFEGYYSLDFNERGKGVCPHRSYKINITTYDSSYEHLGGAEVTLNGSSQGTTDANGKMKIYLHDGSYTLKSSKTGHEDGVYNLTVDGSTCNVLLVAGRELDNESGEGLENEIEKQYVYTYYSFDKVELGRDHSSAITEDGYMYIWGDNGCGQLGNGTTVDNYEPKRVRAEITDASLSNTYSLALRKNGKINLWGWGFTIPAWNGSIAPISPQIHQQLKPVDQIWSYTFKDIAAGEFHALGVTTSGRLYSWGNSSYGALGIGSMEPLDQQLYYVMDDVKSVAADFETSAAIKNNGDLYIWGQDGGNLGLGKYHDDFLGDLYSSYYSSPQKLMSNVREVSLGQHFGAAVTYDGGLYIWGDCGDMINGGDSSNKYTPVRVMNNVISVSCGAGFIGAITADGSLYMWGNNSSGQLGNGTTTDSNTPIRIMGDVKSVSCGYSHTGAVTTDGRLYMWGANESGQLGNGTTEDCLEPENRQVVQSRTEVDNSASQASAAPQALYINKPIRNIKCLADTPAVTIEAGTAYTKQFTDLTPNEVYNFYVMRSSSEENPLNDGNLLYVGQYISDENGNLDISYTTAESCENAEIFVKGMHENVLSESDVEVEDLTYDIVLQEVKPVVTYNGVVLEEGKDYTLSGDTEVSEPGVYNIKVSGTGEYGGTVDKSYEMICTCMYDENNICVICGHYANKLGEFKNVSLTLDGKIGINFYYTLDKRVTDDSGAYMQLTLPDGNTDEILISDLTPDDQGRYIFTAYVAAKNTTDKVTAQLVLSDGTLGTAYEYSVQDYADYVNEHKDEYYDASAVVNSMNRYGSLANAYFSDTEVSEESIARLDGMFGNSDLSGYGQKISGNEAGISYYGSSLMLKSETAVRHYFTLNGSKPISEYTFMLGSQKLEPAEKNGYYYVDIPGIGAGDIDTVYTLKVGGLSIEYSALSYVKTVLEKSDDDSLKNLVKALYLYNRRAESYGTTGFSAVDICNTGNTIAALMSDGSLYMWGRNNYGQLGCGTTENSTVPYKVMDNVKYIALEENGYVAAAITNDGDLYTWGKGSYGQLGNGKNQNSSVPVKIMENAKSVYLGYYHGAAISEDDSLFTWGENCFGALGNGKSGGESYMYDEGIDSNVPTKIMSNIASFDLSTWGSMAVNKSGNLYVWGTTNLSSSSEYTTPRLLLSDIAQAEIAYNCGAAVTNTGDLYTWGENSADGGIGIGYFESQYNKKYSPQKILSDVRSVSITSCGYGLALKNDGTVYGWGNNSYGQLGNGSKTNKSSPVKATGITDVEMICTSDDSWREFSAAVTKDKVLYMWGSNNFGKLGISGSDSPTPCAVLENVYKVSTFAETSSAISNGMVYTWGCNTNGQLGNGKTSSSGNITPTAVLIY